MNWKDECLECKECKACKRRFVMSPRYVSRQEKIFILVVIALLLGLIYMARRYHYEYEKGGENMHVSRVSLCSSVAQEKIVHK